ncbi:SDR family oxidoreductase [Corynebacterium macclintockiae]|uniref:SDR family oxidoreductase n=1 Tax=Corynebacterium macclintockiae TaxID=2913501 RepID=UPI003EB8B7B3
MSVLVFGASGQVGRALLRLRPDFVPVGRAQADLAVAGSVDSFLLTPPSPVEAIVNLAAFTAVDDAEKPENASAVHQVNAVAPGRMASWAWAHGVPMLHVSTDYVFPGTLPVGWENPVDGQPAPVNAYGRSKLEGERQVLNFGGRVVRTGWVYDAESRNFATTMVRLARSGVNPTVVDDQYGRPTHASVLAAELAAMVDGKRTAAISHVTGSGPVTTWCGFAREIFATIGHDPRRVKAVPSSEYPTLAHRPRNSTLQIPASGLPAWRDSLRVALG